MSDVPESIASTAEIVSQLPEETTSIWVWVFGVIGVLLVGAFIAYKVMNRPTFVINMVRKRTMKSIKEQGGENSEFVADMDRLLDAVKFHAVENKLSGGEAMKLLQPMSDKDRVKNSGDVYRTMIYIAKEIKADDLVRDLTSKSKQMKSGSALMAGLFKRAGI
ncbi:hypothetical protein [Thaumasiovibrio subtropicus]|uniref:hypothetical protein n=1 Tax=Thaumasiovibrio subtropicus TaxID=1891207 RepID=UPI000B350503|nr:hypothetical protein [Thaumasiovibrio subtropicus]